MKSATELHASISSKQFKLGSISSWDWLKTLQSLQMIGKFLFMVPYNKYISMLKKGDNWDKKNLRAFPEQKG